MKYYFFFYLRVSKIFLSDNNEILIKEQYSIGETNHVMQDLKSLKRNYLQRLREKFSINVLHNVNTQNYGEDKWSFIFGNFYRHYFSTCCEYKYMLNLLLCACTKWDLQEYELYAPWSFPWSCCCLTSSFYEPVFCLLRATKDLIQTREDVS